MKTLNRINLLVTVMMLFGLAIVAQSTDNSKTIKNDKMKTYLIEREIPNAGSLTGEELKGISQKSCGVLTELGPKIEWLHSYVTGNKIYCIYRAESEELIREHAKRGGFPANKIVEVANVISPATAK